MSVEFLLDRRLPDLVSLAHIFHSCLYCHQYPVRACCRISRLQARVVGGSSPLTSSFVSHSLICRFQLLIESQVTRQFESHFSPILFYIIRCAACIGL